MSQSERKRPRRPRTPQGGTEEGKDDELARIRRQRGLRLRAEVRAGNYEAEPPDGAQRASHGASEDVAQERDEGPALGG